MKKINLLIIGVICFYAVALLITGVFVGGQSGEKSREYLVEVNRMISGMEEQGGFFMPDLRTAEQIEDVSFLEFTEGEELTKPEAEEFFRKRNGCETHMEPLMAGDRVLGLVRFDYRSRINTGTQLWIAEGMLVLSCAFTLVVLFYLKHKLVRPFLTLRDMPYELSKGRLGTEIEENKDRFFGKFVWGIAMLRDNLKSSQLKALKLEKEKKLLLLSISHDIKTPLNSIKLYAKALQEGLYSTKEEQMNSAKQIEKLSGEIEEFVRDIVRTSSEEIVPIEVENSEFYLKDFVKIVREYYEPKCRLVLTELVIGDFDNKLLKGSLDGAFEVVENIMENAFKYGDGRRIEITFYEEEACQLIKIRNTGSPVKAEEMPHLFDSFYRGSNVGNKEGNGLGLYICRELMRKMEGEIFAERQEDGMSFHLVFQL